MQVSNELVHDDIRRHLLLDLRVNCPDDMLGVGTGSMRFGEGSRKEEEMKEVRRRSGWDVYLAWNFASPGSSLHTFPLGLVGQSSD